MDAPLNDVPTKELYQRLTEAFEHFNEVLFEGELPNVIITVQRGMRTRGQFSPDRWAANDGTRAHEIAINPAHLASNPLLELFQTIVREQVHCWQHCFGNPSRRGYQNGEFRDKMRELGLQTSDSGQPGGREVGQNLRDYPIKNGQFLKAAAALLSDKDWVMPWIDRECRESASEAIASWALAPTPGNALDDMDAGMSASHALRASDPSQNVDMDADLVAVVPGEIDNDSNEAGLDHQAPRLDPAPRSNMESEIDSEAPIRALAETLPGVKPEVINTLVGARMADLMPDTADIVMKPSAKPKSKTKSKVKYECSCDTKVWGKPGLSIKCNKCSENFIQEAADDDPDALKESDTSLSDKTQVVTPKRFNEDEMEGYSLAEALAQGGEFDDDMDDDDALATEDDDTTATFTED